MKIDIESWKEFSIEELFWISRGKTLSVFDKDYYSGTIPCINGSSENNGVFCYLNESICESGFKLQKSPALSLSRVGNSGRTFYQNTNFFIADNAFALHLKNSQSHYVYQFISTILNLEEFKYSYGRTISIEKYKKVLIKLPSTYNGNPDFKYMENYIKTLHYKQITTTINKQNTCLDVNKWKEFELGNLFNFVKGKRLTKQDMIEGDINYLGAISENNGVRQHIEVDNKYINKPNCITVNYNGSVGEAFYQHEPFWASDDINILYPRDWDINKYIAMFICTVIKANRYKFSYGRKWTLEKMKESLIKLPVKNDGTPDFNYMENYIKSLPYSDRI